MKLVLDIKGALYCLLFAIAFAFTDIFAPKGGNSYNFIVSFVLGLLLSAFIMMINKKLIDNQNRKQNISISNRRFFAVWFCVYVIMGLITQIVYFPATLSNDTIVVIRGGMGVSGQHPWMYIALLRGLEKIVKFLGGADNEVFIILAILQILLVSFSYSICITWLKCKGISNISLYSIAGFFAICPILNLYMVTLIKDVPFALSSLLIIPLMYELWKSKGQKLSERKYIIELCVCSIFFFFRNNGIIVCLFLAIYTLIVYRKFWKRTAIYLSFIIMLILMTKAVQAISHAPYRFREAAGIPIQQIAATVCKDGNIDDEQYTFIDKLLPIDEIKKTYDPYNVDKIKYGEIELDSDFLNQNRGQFLKVWGELLVKNFGVYVDAYMRTTYGFWSFSNNTKCMRYTYIGAFADQTMYYDWMNDEKIVEKSILPKSVQTSIEGFYNSINYFLGAGVMAWLILGLVVTLIKKAGWRIVIVGLPALLCWITLLISTPVAFQWRYALSFAYSLPLLYGILLIPTLTEPK